MKLLIINGPNLNLVGKREPKTYGNQSFEAYFHHLQGKFPAVTLESFQSNIEGELIDKIQQSDADGIILNAGGYTHTSVAIRDCIAAVNTAVVEVHISNVAAREVFRHTSFITPVAKGCICGFGLLSYDLAIVSFLNS